LDLFCPVFLGKQADSKVQHQAGRTNSNFYFQKSHFSHNLSDISLPSSPIDSFFTNCRSSRSTDVDAKYDARLESKWIWHSEAIARHHYHQVRDIDIQKALKENFSPPNGESEDNTGSLP